MKRKEIKKEVEKEIEKEVTSLRASQDLLASVACRVCINTSIACRVFSCAFVYEGVRVFVRVCVLVARNFCACA